MGRTAANAVDELAEHHGAGELMELAIRELPYGLTIRSNPENAQKPDLLGLPLYSTEQAQRDLAIAMATDLAAISFYISIEAISLPPIAQSSAP